MTFSVTIRQLGQLPGAGRTIPATGTDAAAVIMAMVDRYGICLICVRPVTAAP